MSERAFLGWASCCCWHQNLCFLRGGLRWRAPFENLSVLYHTKRKIKLLRPWAVRVTNESRPLAVCRINKNFKKVLLILTDGFSLFPFILFFVIFSREGLLILMLISFTPSKKRLEKKCPVLSHCSIFFPSI